MPRALLSRIETLEVLGTFSLLQLASLGSACFMLSCFVLPMSRPELQPHDVRNSTRLTIVMSVVLAACAMAGASFLASTKLWCHGIATSSSDCRRSSDGLGAMPVFRWRAVCMGHHGAPRVEEKASCAAGATTLR
jgi:hypothetical protein